jgi:hypothetical protein
LLRPVGGQSTTYILTAAHVVAPTGFGVVAGNSIVDDQSNPVGTLTAFTDPADCGVDAAIIELNVAADPAQGTYGVPTGWGNAFWDDMEVRAQAGSTGPMSMQVKKINTDPTVNYPSPGGPTPVILRSQLTCVTSFMDGDSGSAALNPYGSLIGLVVANWQSFGIVSPIMSILDALRVRGFDLEPVVDRSTTDAIILPTLPIASDDIEVEPEPPWPGAVRLAAPAVDDSRMAIDVLARTLWAEAAIDFDKAVDQNNNPIGDKALRAVAEVIMNRVRRPGWWGNSVESVCKAQSKGTFQFSCWSPKDPQYKYTAQEGPPPSAAYSSATKIAGEVVQGWSGTLTDGAYNYYADYLATPYWARNLAPCAYLGHHKFFNNVP